MKFAFNSIDYIGIKFESHHLHPFIANKNKLNVNNCADNYIYHWNSAEPELF